MPTLLPVRTQSKPTAAPEAKRAPRLPSVTPLDICALCVGLAACLLAAFIYFSSGDRVGTAMVLVLSAVVVLAMWRTGSDHREIDEL